MALNFDPTFPPSGPAPYQIDSEWCLGDSLTYINLNSANFDTRIETLSTNTNTRINNLSAYATGTALLSSNGYQRLPGGLIMQWGQSGSLSPDGSATLTFPIPFPTTCLRAFVSITNSTNGNDDIFARVISYNTTQIVVRAENTTGVFVGTRNIEYFAIGF